MEEIKYLLKCCTLFFILNRACRWRNTYTFRQMIPCSVKSRVGECAKPVPSVTKHPWGFINGRTFTHTNGELSSSLSPSLPSWWQRWRSQKRWEEMRAICFGGERAPDTWKQRGVWEGDSGRRIARPEWTLTSSGFVCVPRVLCLRFSVMV